MTPTHPDYAGGLGVSGVAQTALLPITFSYTSILAGTFAEEMMYGGAQVRDYVLPLTGIIAAGAVVLCAPLLRFALQLIDVRHRGLLEYGALATTCVRAFDDKWLRRDAPPAGPLILFVAPFDELILRGLRTLLHV